MTKYPDGYRPPMISSFVDDDFGGHIEGYDYRVWHIPQVPMQGFYVHCIDLQAAEAMTRVLAQYDEFQFRHKVKPDYSNVSGIEQWCGSLDEGFEWIGIDDPEEIEELLMGELFAGPAAP